MFYSLINEYFWISTIGFLVIVAILLSWFEVQVYSHLYPKFLKTQYRWDSALLYASHIPFHFLLWLVTISLIIPLIGIHFGFGKFLIEYTKPIRELIFVISFIWFAFQLCSALEQSFVLNKPKKAYFQDSTTVHALAQLSRVFIIIMGILLGMQSLGISVAVLLTLGSVSGLVIGFAAKDSLNNFMGGLLIYWDRPFSVGDWIRSPDREIEGTVEYIGWRLTRLSTIDNRPIYVPNSIFSNIIIENPGRMINRHLKIILGIRYEDASKLPMIINEIQVMLQQRPEIDLTQTILVRLIELGSSSLNILIRAYTKSTNRVIFYSIQQEILFEIIAILDKYQAECAFPTQTLYFSELIETKNKKNKK